MIIQLIFQFGDANEFLQNFKNEKKTIESDLTSRVETKEIKRLVKKGNKILTRLKSAIKKLNERTAFKLYNQIMEIVLKLNRISSSSINPISVQFLNEVSPILEDFEKNFQSNLEEKQKKKQSQLESYRHQIDKLLNDVHQANTQLNTTVENKFNKNKKKADELNKNFKS